MTAAFTCAAALASCRRCANADYIGSWLEVLREDNRAIVRAASAASKAADFPARLLAPEAEAVKITRRSGGCVVTRQSNATAPPIAPDAEERYGHYIREALTTEGSTSPSAAAASPCTSPAVHISAGTTARPSRRPASPLACRSSTAEGWPSKSSAISRCAARWSPSASPPARRPGVPSPTRRSRLSRMPIARPERSVWKSPPCRTSGAERVRGPRRSS